MSITFDRAWSAVAEMERTLRKPSREDVHRLYPARLVRLGGEGASLGGVEVLDSVAEKYFISILDRIISHSNKTLDLKPQLR